ncbi:MAG TPA: PSD1 and planctomycete cytochrome C domain-containing protein [Planctomycetaceae bacterium]|nr:PSD1 and planctomycete cytochrome C domain-containing protein [Planctomycetaceae bacterium]
MPAVRCCLPLLALLSSVSVFAADSTPGEEFFESKVRPLLSQHCFACHGRDQKKGGLSLASREALMTGGESGPTVVLEHPADSLLIQAVEHRGGLQMPPNGKLTDAEQKTLRTWVELGLPWSAESDHGGIRANGTITADDRDFWSFRPVVNTPVPTVKYVSWPRRTLDAFILSQLETNGLQPAAEADRRTYIRRVSWTLTGLLPTPEDVQAFVSDTSDDAYEKLVSRLLDSPHYGERWARHWLDIARYGEDQAHTFQARKYPEGYRYRDWVVNAFNRDLPYDQFVMEQIAADLLPAATLEERLARLPALGFFALGPVYYKDAGCAGKAEADEIDDRIDTLCRGFLGLTVSCARCHDHKFDPIPTQDYYALAGVFASTQYREAPLVADEIAKAYEDRANAVKQREKEYADAQAAESLRFGETLVPQTADYIVAAWKLQQRRQDDIKTGAKAIADESGLHAVTIQRWSDFLTGNNFNAKPYLAALKPGFAKHTRSIDDPVSALLEPAARMLQHELATALEERHRLEAEYEQQRAAAATEEAKKNVAKPNLEGPRAELLKGLLTDRNAPFAVPKDQIEKLLSDDRKAVLTAIQKDIEQLKQAVGPKYPFAHSLSDGQPTNAKVNVRGNHKDLGDEVPRRFLTILDTTPFKDGSGRRELARAIASPANPLTARVIVNRVWQQHFGRGIVGTASNFGLLGERPTHPELLDHLAAKFIEAGWSLKWLHREILLSATYRQSSEVALSQGETDSDAIDPDNRLLWRQNRRRMDIETWRDAALQVSGQIDLTVGGPSQNLNDANHRRRTLYSAISRHDLNATLRLFDFPDPNLTSERRSNTTVPMQQLFLLNSGFIVKQAQTVTQRVMAEKMTDDEQRIERVYQWLFQRSPTDGERQLGRKFLNAALPSEVSATEVKLTAWEQYAQALLGTNEFAFID